MSFFKRLFRRKKAPPLACHLDLDQDENHVHTEACFLEVQPLAVAELFQSQSCQSCPPAVPSILDATNHPNILHLTYDVTYFDHLGWKDTFSNPRWDQRQKSYVRKWGRTSLYTPMVVVNGVADGGSGGGSKSEVDGVVQRARETGAALGFHIYVDANETGVRIDTDLPAPVAPMSAPPTMMMTAEGGVVADAALPPPTPPPASSALYDILFVTYGDGTEVVKITKGPNKGKKVSHKNVVREISKIGEWKGGDAFYQLPALPTELAPGTAAAVIVQAPGSGPIIAVAKVV
ncbi:thioredoxin-like protein [Xylariales sp. PMI_506]|nr:thioredoxin-like protein [Xylariales sp. PMI_506]